MKYVGMAVTDIGISKETNQDSVCIKVAETPDGRQVVMTVMCDGMGGLDKGELASATVIRCFCDWFDNALPYYVENYTWEALGEEWRKLVVEQNQKIGNFGKLLRVSLGTTLTAMLILNDQYMTVHVGDSRVYRITDRMEQLTEDQTFVAREMRLGNMTYEQAMNDPRRNVLLQCVGASGVVEPEIRYGTVVPGSAFLFCTDGFRHVITEQDMLNVFRVDQLGDTEDMRQKMEYLIGIVKSRGERDNITTALLKCI